MSQLHPHQLKSLLKTITGDAEILQEPSADICDWFSGLNSRGCLRLPWDPYEMYLIPERMAVYGDLRGRHPTIEKILAETPRWVGVIGDNRLMGKEGLLFVTLSCMCSDIDTWLNSMSAMDLVVKSVPRTNNFILAAPVMAFVSSYV